MRRIGVIVESAEKLALGDFSQDVRDAALRVEAFVRYYETLIEMAAEGAMPLNDDGVVGEVDANGIVQPIIVIRQFVNPLFITWWRPRPDGPRDIEEKVFTAEMPIWGAAVVLKEVRGVKLELVRGPLPINPCWWWRLFGRNVWNWGWRWYYYRLVPAEFLKTISYVNTWNGELGRPEVIKTVEHDVVIDADLMKFWWFLSDPKAAPPGTDGGDIYQAPVKTKAVLWGELRRNGF
jgi:hypothetical protein